ncbi:unnamed protein product [Camellia sinensis]
MFTRTNEKQKVQACGVCHSDLHVIIGELPFASPCVVGHEITGEVVEHGPLTDTKIIERFPVGAHVVGAFIMPCGSCFFCNKGQDDLCEDFFAYNRAKGTLYDGETRLFLRNSGNRVLGIGTSRACCAKSEVASCCLDVKASNVDSRLVASDGCISLKRFYSAAHGSPNFFMGCCSFLYKLTQKTVHKKKMIWRMDQLISEPEVSEEEDDGDGVEEPQNDLELFDTEVEVTEKRPPQKRASSALFKAIMAAPGLSVRSALDKWVEEGNDLN